MPLETETQSLVTTREGLQYWIEQIIHSELDDHKRLPAGLRDRIRPLARLIMDEIPGGAFDAVRPLDRGLIFFNSDVENEGVNELQAALATAHFTLRKDQPITIYLNSEGGSVYDGLSVNSTIHEIQRAGREVFIHVTGTAMSMGSVILQAGTRRSIEAHGTLMIHQVRYKVETQESVAYHEEELRGAKRETQIMVEEYARRSGRPKEFFLGQISAGQNWYLNASEALNNGLVDEIRSSPFALHTVSEPKVVRRRPA